MNSPGLGPSPSGRQLWPLREPESILETNGQTVGEFLEEFFPGRDIAADLKRVQTFLESLANRIAAIVEPLAPQVCEMVDRLDKLEPAPGYEPMLVERGHHPLFARGVSYRIIDLAKDEARKAKSQRVVIAALRFMSKPGRTQRSISRKAAILLEEWNTTPSNLSDVFYGVDFSVFEFVEALEGAVRGDLAACRRSIEVAAALAPRLSARRGPKAGTASIAHELLLTYVAHASGTKSYTYDPISEDYTDSLTGATRSAFGDPDFDPSPARRRQRKRFGPMSR